MWASFVTRKFLRCGHGYDPLYLDNQGTARHTSIKYLYQLCCSIALKLVGCLCLDPVFQRRGVHDNVTHDSIVGRLARKGELTAVVWQLANLYCAKMLLTFLVVILEGDHDLQPYLLRCWYLVGSFVRCTTIPHLRDPSVHPASALRQPCGSASCKSIM